VGLTVDQFLHAWSTVKESSTLHVVDEGWDRTFLPHLHHIEEEKMKGGGERER
jgi:hypothetical protein